MLRGPAAGEYGHAVRPTGDQELGAAQPMADLLAPGVDRRKIIVEARPERLFGFLLVGGCRRHPPELQEPVA